MRLKLLSMCEPYYPKTDPLRGRLMAADPDLLAELDTRIAILRDNLRELIEQAAGYSGAADESRNADRIADQQAKLDALLIERERLTKAK